MHIGWPQGILLWLLLVGVGLNLGRDGKPRGGNYSFFWSLVNAAVLLGLLLWGGFFK
jgi:hypothetical protein